MLHVMRFKSVHVVVLGVNLRKCAWDIYGNLGSVHILFLEPGQVLKSYVLQRYDLFQCSLCNIRVAYFTHAYAENLIIHHLIITVWHYSIELYHEIFDIYIWFEVFDVIRYIFLCTLYKCMIRSLLWHCFPSWQNTLLLHLMVIISKYISHFVWTIMCDGLANYGLHFMSLGVGTLVCQSWWELP